MMEQEFVKREPLREPYRFNLEGGNQGSDPQGDEGFFLSEYKHPKAIFRWVGFGSPCYPKCPMGEEED